MHLPVEQKNAVEIKLHASQIDKTKLIIDPRIFPKRCFAIIYGSRFTGKSVIISNLINDFYLKKRHFDGVLVLTPSGHDPAWNLIRNRKRVTISDTCTNEFLFELLEEQEYNIENGFKCEEILIVVDDFATQCKNLKALEEISTRGRHAHLTVILTAQYSRLLSPTIRQQATNVILFKMSDMELTNLANEGLKSLIDTDEFVRWVKQHTQKPRSFVHINLKDVDRVFNIGFSE